MKKIFIIILLFTVQYVTAQEEAEGVPFVSYWELGDKYTFKITKIKEKWRKGEQTTDEKSEYMVNFEVVEATETSYKIKWKFKNEIMDGYDFSEEVLEKFKKYDFTEVIYSTSEVGELIGIDNWEEISNNMISLFDDLVDEMSEEKNVDKEIMRKAMEPLKAAYVSKEGIEQIVFKELAYFHFPFGVEFPENETILYEDAIPNIFGGKPLRANVSVKVKDVDREKSTCTLIQNSVINEDDALKMVLSMVKKMEMSSSKIKKMLKKAVFDIKDTNRYEFYYFPGIPIFIETIRTTVINIENTSAKSIEKIVIELIE